MKVGWAQAFYMYDFVIFSSYTNIKLIENTIPLITVLISENALKFAFTFFLVLTLPTRIFFLYGIMQVLIVLEYCKNYLK